jgi:hypothetical protein
MSEIDRNNSVTVTFSTNPFGPYFPETMVVSGIHPTLGLDLQYNANRHHCQLLKMNPGTPSHRLSQWKYHLRYAYILSIDTMPIHTINDVRLIISEARSDNRKYHCCTHERWCSELSLCGRITSTVLRPTSNHAGTHHKQGSSSHV